MTIPQNSVLRATAADRLRKAGQVDTITLIYAAIVLGFSAFAFALQFFLDSKIGALGGLAAVGRRSQLETISRLMFLVQMALGLCLNLGYQAVMLRSARELNVSPYTLEAGFERFFPLLRSVLLRFALYAIMAMGSFYAAALIYAYTPSARGLSEAVSALPGAELTPELLLQNTAIVDAFQKAVLPICCLAVGIFLIFGLPVIYGYRLTEFVILDNPHLGARYALRMSKRMMRGAKRSLLRVDLSFWWYYALNALAAVLCYSDLLLSLAGIDLPISDTAAYFLSYGLYLVCQLAIFHFFKAKVEQVYALIYDSGLPKGTPSGGVVLGNIFQM